MKKLLAILLAVLMLTFTACSLKRPPKNTPDPRPAEQEDLTKDNDKEKEPLEPQKPEPSEPASGEIEPPKAPPEDKEPTGSEIKLDTLDNTKQGYGQGIHVDENNRPVGALNLQKKYEKYDAIFIAPITENIYLTFDEGYENGFTSQILDVLKEKQVSAVFFITMPYAKGNPELVKRMLDEGHVLGNHSVKHLSMPTLSIEQARQEILELHSYIKEKYNYEMYLFRPPMGEFSERTLALTKELGYKTMMWSFAYKDYDTSAQPELEAAFKRVTEAHHKGAVYLLHAVSETNTKILGRVIDDLRGKGYTVGAYER